MLHGLPVLRRLEALPTDDAERPFQSVLISECGELTAEEVKQRVQNVELGGEELLIDSNLIGGAVDMGGEAMVAAANNGDIRLVRSLVERGSTDQFVGCYTLYALTHALISLPQLTPSLHTITSPPEVTLPPHALLSPSPVILASQPRLTRHA